MDACGQYGMNRVQPFFNFSFIIHWTLNGLVGSFSGLALSTDEPSELKKVHKLQLLHL